MNDLLILGLRDSAQNHVELTRQLSPETHEAAKHYYSLICAEYCELVEKANREELAMSNNKKLTDEVLQKIFFISDDGLLYRKVIESSPFCCVNRWNIRAARNEPVTVDYVSLKPVGLSSYRTEIIIECLKFGVKKYYDSIKSKVVIVRERNLDKAVKAQKAKHVVSPHNLKNGAKKTQDMSALNRGIAEIIKAQIKPTQKPKPTISEVLSQARKTSNFREAYLSALKEGAYRV